ncbi:MAG: helix-turn-helix domain-containing protein [Eubacteriales bacterium]
MINYYATEFIREGDGLGIFERVLTRREDVHTHAFYALIFINEGNGLHQVDQKSYDMAPGSVFFIDRSVPHAMEPFGELRYTETILTSDFFGKDGEGENELRRIFYTDSEYQPTVTLSQDERETLDAILRCTSREYERRAGDFRAFLRLYVSLICQYLSRAMERARSELANRDPAYILSVTLEYVDKHFTENISQEELAARFGYNYAYFSRMFKKHMGENLSDYITKKRIELAARLLVETDFSAEQVSERVGYKSKPQFYNTFTKYMKKTPRQYRLDARQKQK